MFRALVLEKEPAFSATVQSLEETRLPDADVHVQVAYSTLNYKDGLAITNKSPVVRVWPMVAGIDGAGSVISSTHADWKAGDHFVHNGWGVGETHWGCLSEQARLKGDWLVKLPKAFTPRQAMAIGTAGYTAMLCVMALEQQGVQAGKGEVLVTGATGGVGSVAVALLAKLGYQVVAATGKASEEAYLKSLGANSIIIALNCRHPVNRFKKNAGPVWSTPLVLIPLPTRWPKPVTAAQWPPADWPRAWICRPRSCRLFCATCV